jgi:hypothetical protein
MLTVHALPGASGVVNEQVVPVTLYNPPILIDRVSAVICNGTVALVLVIVTTLVTGARGVGIVKVRVRTPKTVVSVPFVAEVKASVPAFTVNVTVLLVPPGVVTLTVLAERAAVAEIVKFAVTEVSLTTVMAPTVMPVPDTLIADVPVRFVPVRVTATVLPRCPVLGEIEVRVGAGGSGAAPNSTAPTSTALLVFLALPKKSKLGAAA